MFEKVFFRDKTHLCKIMMPQLCRNKKLAKTNSPATASFAKLDVAIAPLEIFDFWRFTCVFLAKW